MKKRAKYRRLLVVLSGIDGGGKSTQIELLKDYYQRQGLSPVCLWTRGGYTSLFNAVKEAARRLSRGQLPTSGPSEQRDELLQRGRIQYLWLTLAILDLIRVYGVQVRWWLLRGRPVLCDRYLWDTLIDFRLLFPGIQVEDWPLWKILVWLTPRPDAAFLLMIPLDESERRCQIKYEPFPDTTEMREKRFANYQEASRRGYWQILDATKPAADVAGEILRVLESHARDRTSTPMHI